MQINGDYIGGSKVTAKAWRAGWLNQASDFAHSSQETFNTRSFGERMMMFGAAAGASFIGGTGEGSLKKMRPSIGKSSLLVARQASAGYLDYHMQQTLHSSFKNDPAYMPWQYKYMEKKIGVQSYKALFYGLKID